MMMLHIDMEACFRHRIFLAIASLYLRIQICFFLRIASLYYIRIL